MVVNDLKKALKQKSNLKKAKVYAGFFKTGPGQYGQGDKFLGLTVPEQRAIAKNYQDLSLNEIEQLLADVYHEVRLTASLILVAKFEQAQKHNDLQEQKLIFDFYCQHSTAFNNWDLVDLTASKIVGQYLLASTQQLSWVKSAKASQSALELLTKLAKSNNLWSRRISIVATQAFIRAGQFALTLALAQLLLNDKHDLIHKAVGWMLREVGKKDKQVLLDFLDQHAKQMPRTMLRYAIERLPTAKRQQYLKR